MGSLVWKVMGAGSAILGAAIGQRVVNTGWRVATGEAPPDDPSHPEDVSWQQALAFSAATGLVVSASRVLATRKAAKYYTRSSGHLPPSMVKDDKKGASATA